MTNKKAKAVTFITVTVFKGWPSLLCSLLYTLLPEKTKAAEGWREVGPGSSPCHSLPLRFLVLVEVVSLLSVSVGSGWPAHSSQHKRYSELQRVSCNWTSLVSASVSENSIHDIINLENCLRGKMCLNWFDSWNQESSVLIWRTGLLTVTLMQCKKCQLCLI